MGQLSSAKESSQTGTAWAAWTSVQVSHQIQAIQHKLTSALSQLYWSGSSKQQSSQKTRIQEFDIEGKKHCPCVNRVFSRGTILYQKSGDTLKLWNTKRTNPKPQSQLDNFLQRARVGLTVPASTRQRGRCVPGAAVWRWSPHHEPAHSTICSPTQCPSPDSTGPKWICPPKHS